MRRVRAHGRGWVFTPRDFLDLGTRAAVDQALKRQSVRELKRDPQTEGHLELRRLAHGIYDYPRWDLDGTAALPDPDAIARAISRRDKDRVVASGAHNAAQLGLTQAAPEGRRVYLTDGPDRVYDLGERRLEMRHAGPDTMAWANRPGAPVVLALDWLGPQLTEVAKAHLRSQGLSKAAIDDIRDNIFMAPSYLQPALRELVGRKQSRRRRRAKRADAATSGEGDEDAHGADEGAEEPASGQIDAHNTDT
ncbi:hypothetical protein CKO28_09150 [Rhodovibrio sodomensis]|uniref:Type IV toxin-antitoxin system AbiEi family antitoxin domain-containing protein n=1 Tax=Rhodovibrio sodomensis TaxID=1088 RepID=A0ABS1DCK8_9PROT|nr:DUF6088 family protein [Rhodovibrio sodomensis]MBK1668203.1 hypothetical protein [Rhodovibrio sodomensis]